MGLMAQRSPGTAMRPDVAYLLEQDVITGHLPHHERPLDNFLKSSTRQLSGLARASSVRKNVGYAGSPRTYLQPGVTFFW